jgi:hypothetical protein
MQTDPETGNTRKLALAAGVLYLVTFAVSIPTLGLKAPLVDHADWILGNGSDNGVIFAGFLDILCGLAGIGTAVALYPVVRRFSPTAAIGFIASRTLEAAILVVGAISLLSIVTLRSHVVGDTESLMTTSRALVAAHDWSFLFGPAFMASVNALFLATAMYRFRLVPRIIPLMGLVGAPLLFGSSIVTMFGGHAQTSVTAMLCTLPIAAWELSLGVYMTVKGFRRPAVGTDVPVASPALAA